MTERLSERERIRAILLNKTPLEAADWHLAEVDRIVKPLLSEDLTKYSKENLIHLIEIALKRANGGE